MAIPTAQDQLFLELVNRGRLDPGAEAARFGIDLNQGLAAGTISGAQKQPLTFNLLLNDAAYSHTAWMLATDTFSHTGVNRTTPGDRMANAGYAFWGNWSWGENIAWVGTTGSLNANTSILQLYQNLFLSAGHRENTLDGNFKESGVSLQTGQFASGGINYNTEMVTETFAHSAADNFVTGVGYNDADNNDFYSVGEGNGGLTVDLYSGSSLFATTTTWGSGGYSLDTTATGPMHIAFTGGSIAGSVGANFFLGSANVKIDVVDGNTIQSSVSATLTDAAVNLTLLGINAADGTGDALANTITGNKGANTLAGLGGNDLLVGGTGSDTYMWSSGDGNDRIDDAATGTTDSDLLALANVASSGVALNRVGNDLSIVVLATGEIITVANQFNAATAGAGIETLHFGDGTNWSRADIALHLQPAAPIGGTEGADVLWGTAESDVISGLGGNDILNGLAGADVLNGGDGSDTASYAGSVAAVTVNLAKGVATGGHAAGDTFTSIENITGSAFNDVLTGNVGDNRLDGGLGNDAMAGGLGNDTYVVNATSDKVTELANQGADTIETSLASYSLASLVNVENLIFSGSGTFSGTGNALANFIAGGSGNDILNGGAGADWLAGHGGDDTYVVDNAGDVVDESGGAGNDLVQSAVTFSLADGAHALGDIERLTLTGAGIINGTGNDLANVITGNAAANIIEGMGGVDVLDGGAGVDTLSYATSDAGVNVALAGAAFSLGAGGDAEGDTFKNFENIIGSGFNDSLAGDKLANVLDGGFGADFMAGGAGNDTYVVNETGDVVFEALATGGTDIVRSAVTFVLGANVEILVLTGGDSIGGTGNGLANTLTGNIGNNRLDGGSGIDSMTGGYGDDTYVVDNARDRVTELANQGHDRIETSLASYSLAKLVAIEDLVFDNGNLADVAFTGTGNGLDNLLAGGSANDKLSGGAGNDVLLGLAGNDLLTGGAGSDVFRFTEAGFGNDKITDYVDTLDHLSFSLSLADSFDDFSISGNGTRSVTVSLGLDSIVVAGTANITLAADDFIFV